MGRHRKKATKTGKIAKRQNISSGRDTDKVEKRLFQKQICCSCDARNSQTANKCRKCGSKDLRSKNSEYADG